MIANIAVALCNATIELLGRGGGADIRFPCWEGTLLISEHLEVVKMVAFDKLDTLPSNTEAFLEVILNVGCS